VEELEQEKGVNEWMSKRWRGVEEYTREAEEEEVDTQKEMEEERTRMGRRGRKCKGKENINFEQSLAMIVKHGRVVD